MVNNYMREKPEAHLEDLYRKIPRHRACKQFMKITSHSRFQPTAFHSSGTEIGKSLRQWSRGGVFFFFFFFLLMSKHDTNRSFENKEYH